MYIWPASKHACFIAKLLLTYGVETYAFIDRDPAKAGQTVLGRQVISSKDFEKQCGNSGLLIGGLGAYFSIWKDIHDMGCLDKGCVLYNVDRLNELQYFGPTFMSPVPNEIYVDLGCAGYTIHNFINFCKGKYRKIIGFEAIIQHYNQALKTTDKYENVEIYPYAAWSSNSDIGFHIGTHEMAVTDNTGREYTKKIMITAKRIDDIVKDNVTLIKMDVEGAELEALKGASNIINLCKPRLAISIYHHERDIIDIPSYIHDLNPGYKMYIRHHSAFPWETVLYAI